MGGADAPAHLVSIEDGFGFWRWVRLRGAGFPASFVLDLAMPKATIAEAALTTAETVLAEARAAAVAEAEALVGRTEGEARAAHLKLARKLRGAGIPEVPGDHPLAAAITVLSARGADVQRARAEWLATFEAENRRAGEAIRRHASDPRFREALTWQNRAALKNAVEPLLRSPAGATDKDTRNREILVARYLQRYAVKNDTIGFFGPVGWGTIERAGPRCASRPGRELLARRTVYFEHWCIDALAQRLASNEALRAHLAPRRMPTLHLEGTTLCFPVERTATISDASARLLSACDGARTALEIANEVAADPELGLDGAEEALHLLGELAEQSLITWTLEIPPGPREPETVLRELLERVPVDARGDALEILDDLERHRRAVAAAAGDAEALARALDDLGARFELATGSSATRRGGETYAGRTLVYEDCLRDNELTLGPALVDELRPPLDLLLRSARWYTFEIAKRYRQAFHEAYRALARDRESPAVDFLRYKQEIAPLWTHRQSETSPIVAAVVAELRDRWSRVLGWSAEPRTIERSASELAPAVKEAFAAPGPGWPVATFHSPDVMIAARSVEDIARGDYRFVLGELHVSANTLLTHLALTQHPTPEELVQARARDLERAGLSPVESALHSTRADHFSPSPDDWHLELGATRSWRHRERVLAAGELLVDLSGDTLLVRSRDGRFQMDLVEAFEHYLMFASLAHFDIVPRAKHAPRVTIDRVVLTRESWRFEASELGFLERKTPVERFAGARRFAAAHGLPRFSFFRVPEEPKPCFLDLESSVYVENFAKMASRAESVKLSEMLPAFDDLWLGDANGRRYTSELRLAITDMGDSFRGVVGL